MGFRFAVLRLKGSFRTPADVVDFTVYLRSCLQFSMVTNSLMAGFSRE